MTPESIRGSEVDASLLRLASHGQERSPIELPWSKPVDEASLPLTDASGNQSTRAIDPNLHIFDPSHDSPALPSDRTGNTPGWEFDSGLISESPGSPEQYGSPEQHGLHEHDEMSGEWLPSVHSSVPSQSRPRPDWVMLPEGLLYKSYLAGPHEPRISTVLFSDTEKGVLWDATLGGRVGLLRYGTPGAAAADGWQWDLEGAVMVRLDVENSEDVESMDFRFGTLITRADGPWSAKFGYFHISSHVGDEYMERFPTFQRVNYVTESLIAGVSYQASDPLRLYGEFAYAVKTSGGAKPIQIQIGAEHVPVPLQPKRGGPFNAINLDVREAVDFSPTVTLQTGWQWQGMASQRRLRFGLQYLNGYTTQFEFFNERERQIGVGSWFDY
ncbi:protein containing DUF1207 [Rhodopirellula maiorica SM1]|uniref:Protein containing DUF1207 n=2 Tax=Novipirellula TaxID=2795426 RepID=M5RL78_9BACT|nr:protein containing DUF1207 [Rhodopirellula maiorica SM1]